jgi:hypothetical protein
LLLSCGDGPPARQNLDTFMAGSLCAQLALSPTAARLFFTYARIME